MNYSDVDIKKSEFALFRFIKHAGLLLLQSNQEHLELERVAKRRFIPF